MRGYVKKNALKVAIKKRGFRAGEKCLDRLAKAIDIQINHYIEKALRQALISGRKTLREEDLK